MFRSPLGMPPWLQEVLACGPLHAHAHGHRGHRPGHEGHGPWAHSPWAHTPWSHGPWHGLAHGSCHGASLSDEVLATLEGQARTGLEVHAALGDHDFAPEPEALYPVLQLLVDRGQVRSLLEDGRTRYELTDAGREQLASRPAGGHPPESWAEVFTPEVRDELRRTREQFGDLVRTLHRRMIERAITPDQVLGIARILQRTMAELKQT